jgi:hypothetical protein
VPTEKTYFCETNPISPFTTGGCENLFLRNEPNFSIASRESPLAPHRERNGLNPMQGDADIGRVQGTAGRLIRHTVNQR